MFTQFQLLKRFLSQKINLSQERMGASFSTHYTKYFEINQLVLKISI